MERVFKQHFSLVLVSSPDGNRFGRGRERKGAISSDFTRLALAPSAAHLGLQPNQGTQPIQTGARFISKCTRYLF